MAQAQRRMISKSISTSTKLMNVDNFAKLLFTWMIPHCDDLGHLEADPKIVKGLVVPLADESVAEIAAAIAALAAANLIILYTANSRPYLEIVKWDDHQTFRIDAELTIKYPRRVPTAKARQSNGKGKVSRSNTLLFPSLPFNIFWDMYPVKKNKKDARPKWDKLSPDVQKKIMEDLPVRIKEDYQWKRGYIPHPTTYLNGERWDDEIQKTGGESKKPGEELKTLKL